MTAKEKLALDALQLACNECKQNNLFKDKLNFCLKCQTLEGCLIASAINQLKGEIRK